MKLLTDLQAIFISIGHGESSRGLFDSGATGDDHTTPEEGDRVSERSVVLAIANELKQILPPEITFYIGDEGDEKSVADKSRAINDLCLRKGFHSRNSLLVSIHANWASPTAEGTFALYQSNDETERKFAGILGDEVAKAAGTVNRSELPDTATRHGRLGILRDTIPVAALIETGFLKNDLEVLKESPELFAKGIKNAIEIASGQKLTGKSISDWAEKEAAFLKELGIWEDQSDPQAPVSPQMLGWVLYKLGLIKKEPPEMGLTQEQLAVVIVRENLYNRAFPDVKFT